MSGFVQTSELYWLLIHIMISVSGLLIACNAHPFFLSGMFLTSENLPVFYNEVHIFPIMLSIPILELALG